MKEAIEDHKASLNREPRSIYGKILSSADRNIDEECYKHTLEKFGNGGYANFFVEDMEYNNYLKELRNQS